MADTAMIDTFSDEYFFLSNFCRSPIEYDGLTYPTMEHYFQAMKTDDHDKRAEIAACERPGEAKKLGRSVTLIRGWERMKIGVMRAGLEQKFASPTSKLGRLLLSTNDAMLVEGNHWHDRFWGCYRDEEGNLDGENWLGFLLMGRRAELRAASMM